MIGFQKLRNMRKTIRLADGVLHYRSNICLPCLHLATVLPRISPLPIVIDRPTSDDFLVDQYFDCVVTDYGRQVIEDAKLTGVEFGPVSASGNGVRATNYWEVLIVGFAGFMRASSVDFVKVCPFCNHTEYQLHGTLGESIDPAKWDGSDAFCVWPLPLVTIFSPRFVDSLKKKRITGFKTVPVADYALSGASPYPVEVLTPSQQRVLQDDPDYNFVKTTARYSFSGGAANMSLAKDYTGGV